MRRMVAFVPGRRERERWEKVCIEDIARHGEVLAAVVGADGKGWADAEAMVDRGEADGIVVGRRDHIPPDALPHVRVAAEQHVGRQRPRVIER